MNVINTNLHIETEKGHNKTSSRLFLISYIFLILLSGIIICNFFLREEIIKSNTNTNNEENEKDTKLTILLKILNIFEYIFITISFGVFLSYYFYTLGTDSDKKLKQFIKIFGISSILIYFIVYITRILITVYSYYDVNLTSILVLFYMGMALLLFLSMITKFIGVSIHHSRIEREGEKKILNQIKTKNVNNQINKKNHNQILN